MLVCGPLHGGACCVGLWSPSWWGVLCWCVPPSWWGVLCRCVPPPPWWGVLRWFVAPLVVGRAALVRGPPLGRACRVGACPPRSLCVVWGVVICSVGCGRVCVVGFAGVGVVLVCAPTPVGACRVRAWPPPWWGVLCRRVRVSVRGVVAGWMPGWFCWFAGVVGCWLSVVSAWPGLVLCWCVLPPLLGRTVLVCGPPLGGACCFGAWPPSRWGVLCWWPPAAVVVFGLVCRWVVVAVVLLAWPGLVLCWCVPPPLLGRVVFVRGSPCLCGRIDT